MFARCESRFMALMCLGLFVCLSAGCGSDDAESKAPEANLSSETDQPATPGATSGTAVSTSTSTNRIEPRPVPTEDLHPEVVFQTSLGVIKVRLDREKARATVDNFLQNYVDRGYYDNTIFHMVDKGFMALGGAYTPELEAKPQRAQIHSEAHNGLKNLRGTIAMNRDPAYPHSAANQFFFNLVDNPGLDHIGRESPEDYGYCVFGEIVEGMAVIDKIAEVPTEDREGFPKMPARTVMIESVRRLR